MLKEQVCIVFQVPKRNNPKEYFQSEYTLATIDERSRFRIYLANEGNLRKYEGIIEDNSPLMLLSKHYKGEITISKETYEKIISNEIILNEKPSWRDIKELNMKSNNRK